MPDPSDASSSPAAPGFRAWTGPSVCETGVPYSSQLSPATGDHRPAAPTPPRAPAAFPLAAALSRVVLPAVERVLRPDELARLALAIGRDEDGSTVVELQLRCGEDEFRWHLWYESWGTALDDTTTAEQVERLADALRDFVAESGFGWGQQR